MVKSVRISVVGNSLLKMWNFPQKKKKSIASIFKLLQEWEIQSIICFSMMLLISHISPLQIDRKKIIANTFPCSNFIQESGLQLQTMFYLYLQPLNKVFSFLLFRCPVAITMNIFRNNRQHKVYLGSIIYVMDFCSQLVHLNIYSILNLTSVVTKEICTHFTISFAIWRVAFINHNQSVGIGLYPFHIL